MLALCLVQFTDVLGVTVVVTALPAMLADLRAPADAASLISAGYAMFFGGLLMTGARLGDRFGHRRTILAGLLVFAAAAVIGVTATSVAVLTAARCLQGAAAALSVPPALRLLTTITADGPQRRQAIAWWSAAGAAAGASGLVAGVLLLIAALTSEIPGPGQPVPVVALALAAALSVAGAALFVRRDRLAAAAPGPALAGSGSTEPRCGYAGENLKRETL